MSYLLTLDVPLDILGKKLVTFRSYTTHHYNWKLALKAWR